MTHGRRGVSTLRRLLAETAGGLPRTFWYLWIGTLVNRIASFVVIFLAFYLTQERGFSETFTGLVIGVQGGGSAIGVLIGGVLADRWGRRSTLVTGHLGTGVALVGLGLSSSAVAIVGWALALGVVSNMVRPAFAAMMVDVVPPKDRIRAFSLNYWAINLGFSVSALLAGLVAQVDYLLLFLLDAGTTLITATIIFVKVAETRPRRAPVSPAAVDAVPPGSAPAGGDQAEPLTAPRPDGLLTVLKDRVFLSFVCLNLLTAVIFMQHLSSLPIAMQRDGLAPSVYGSVIAINGALIVFGQLVVPRLLVGHARSRVLALSALITGSGFGLTAFATGTWLYAVTVLIWTVGEMANSPTNSAVIADLSPGHLRGRYQSVFSLSFSVAALVAPILGGWVIQHHGDGPLWIGCFVLGVITAAGHLAAGPARGAGWPYSAPPSRPMRRAQRTELAGPTLSPGPTIPGVDARPGSAEPAGVRPGRRSAPGRRSPRAWAQPQM